MNEPDFLKHLNAKETTTSLRKLDSENMIKNAFLLEVREQVQQCYNDKGKPIDKEVNTLLSLLSLQIDGVTQNSFELANGNHTINRVCEVLEYVKS